jgi:hypothetical protein
MERRTWTIGKFYNKCATAHHNFFGKYVNPVEGDVFANKKYQLSMQSDLHWKAVFTLSEVDVIDSD